MTDKSAQSDTESQVETLTNPVTFPTSLLLLVSLLLYMMASSVTILIISYILTGMPQEEESREEYHCLPNSKRKSGNL